MAQKFDLYKALQEHGFEEDSTDQFGGVYLTKKYSRIDQVLWVGQSEFRLQVVVRFDSTKTSIKAFYYDGFIRPFKEKAHMNDKRAYNAIVQTIANNGFQI